MDAGGGYPIYQQQQHIHHQNLQQRRNVNLNLLQNQQFAEQNVYISNPNFGIDAPPKPAVLSRLHSRMEKYRNRTQEQSTRYDHLFKKEADEQNKEALILQKQAMDSKTKKTKPKNNSGSTTTTTTDKQPKVIESNVQMQHSVHMPQRNMKRAIEDVENEPTAFEPPTKLPNVDVKQQPETTNISDANISDQFSDFPEFNNQHDNTFNDLINDLQDINPEFLESSMIGNADGDSSLMDILNDKQKDMNLEQFQSDFVKSLEEQHFNIPPSPTQKPSFNIPPTPLNGVMENIPQNGQLRTQFPGQQQPPPTSMHQNITTNQAISTNTHITHQNGHSIPHNQHMQQQRIPNQQNNVLHPSNMPVHQKNQTILQNNTLPIQHQSAMAMQKQVPMRQQVPPQAQTMMQQRQMPQPNNPNQRMQFQQNMPVNRQQQMNFINQRNGLQHHQGIQQQQPLQAMQPQTHTMQNMQPLQSLQKQTQQLQPPLQSMQSQTMQPQQITPQYTNSMPTNSMQGLQMQRAPTHPQVRMNQVPVQQPIPQARMMNQQMGFNQQQAIANRILPQQTAQQIRLPIQSNQMHQSTNIRQQMGGMSQEQVFRQQQMTIRQQMINQQQQQTQPHQTHQSFPPNLIGQVPTQRNPNQMQMQQPVINNQQSMVMNRAGQPQGMMPQQHLHHHHSQQQMQPNQRINRIQPPMQQQQYMQQQQQQPSSMPMVANNVGNSQSMGLDFLDNLQMGSGNDMSAHDLLHSLGNENFDFLP